jgi:2-oxoglutarate dehydrogenase E2 component (dihydrolipoamide succinyltransferase)
MLRQILKDEGAIVTSNELLALMEAQDTQTTVTPSSQPLATETPEKIADLPLSPSVRRLVNENTLDPSAITGTGKSGRLTKTDVLEHLHKQTPAPVEVQPKPSTIPPQSPAVAIVKPSETVVNASNLRPEQRVPMTQLPNVYCKRNKMQPC